MILNEVIQLYFLVGFLLVLIFIAFFTWLIKRGVKKAIEETFYSAKFREQLRNDITYAIISAKKQDFQRNYENSIDEKKTM